MDKAPPLLDLAALDIFRTVAAEGSVTRAAERLSRVQSNVTTRVRQLEADLGTPLFLREGKRLLITPEGSAFHDELIVTYAGLERMAKVAGDIRELRRGHVRFAAIPALCFGPLPRALAAFMA
eukprot:gene46987-57539_t